MNNFELVKKYGASAFVVHKFVQENENVTVQEIMTATGLSDKTIKTSLMTLIDVKLLTRVHVNFVKLSHGYRYSTIQ